MNESVFDKFGNAHLKVYKQRSHDGKSQRTRASAILTATDIANSTDTWMAAYECLFCDWWHVGSYEKFAVSGRMKPAERGVEHRETPRRNEIGDALGDMKQKLKKLFPITPKSEWEDHKRACERCNNYFPRGWRLCRKGSNLYHNNLAWEVRQIIKERKKRV